MLKIVVATGNEDKFREILDILKEVPAEFFSLKDFPDIPEIEETGISFTENALLKARTVHKATGLFTLADDSGLEVDALNGAPGIYSARYAGQEKDYTANNEKLLREMEQLPPKMRGAQFRCVVALVGQNFEQIVEGVIRGRIIDELRGSAGFGYDPLFVPEGYNKTFAELGEEIKNRISHRARAFHKAKEILLNLWE